MKYEDIKDFTQRCEKYPGVYDRVIEQAQTRIKELGHDKK